MITEKRLGKIQKIRHGHGGYDDAMFGTTFTLGGDGWGVGDFWGWWPLSMKRSDNAQWTESDRERTHLDAQRKLEAALVAAKKRSVDELVDVPVEVTIEGNQLKEWRVLTEVL